MGETPQDAPKKSRSWLAAIMVVLLISGGAFYWLNSEHTSNAASVESTLPLDAFVVNLTTQGQRAYLRIGITLGLAHPLLRNKPESIPTALVRDTILGVLATAQPEDLLRAEGKRALKDELLKALQEHAPQMGIQNVYFTEFLVQM